MYGMIFSALPFGKRKSYEWIELLGSLSLAENVCVTTVDQRIIACKENGMRQNICFNNSNNIHYKAFHNNTATKHSMNEKNELFVYDNPKTASFLPKRTFW
jgi:hypothetical protein